MHADLEMSIVIEKGCNRTNLLRPIAAQDLIFIKLMKFIRYE